MNIDKSSLLESIKALAIKDELAKPHLYNVLSLLKLDAPDGAWIGLYLYDESLNALILGPFQGTPACELIRIGKGVVGACFEKGESIFVEDVSTFPGYICCDASAAKEICVPLTKDGNVIGVLDVDYPKDTNLKEKAATYEEAAKFISLLI